jgi:hypothetical protein
MNLLGFLFQVPVGVKGFFLLEDWNREKEFIILLVPCRSYIGVCPTQD